MTTVLDRPTVNGTLTVPDVTGKNLRQRIVMVKQAIGHIGKSAEAPVEMGGFKFTPWEAVSDRLGDLLAAHGIVLWPSMVSSEQFQAGTTRTGKPLWRTKVKLMLDFENADDPTDSRSITWDGEGDDTSDKSTQKAGTSAEKYALMKLFMLGTTGESTDTDNGSPTAAPLQPRPQPAPRPAVTAHDGPYQEGDPCPYCAELGGSGRFKIAAGGRHKGMLECTGKIDGDWMNHLAPLSEQEVQLANVEPSEIPFQ